MKNDNSFAHLVENAFDFLDKAGKEFEKEPKYSVIHFYAAIELFLKARLLHEHWALVIAKPESANLTSFRAGDFQSVTLRDALSRLEAIAQEGLGKDEVNCFMQLGNHRNRMVHFFHSSKLTSPSDIEEIVSQQCRAWFYLHRALSKKWAKVFRKYKSKIDLFDKAMHKQRQYLVAKFGQLKVEIAQAAKNGAIFHKCPSCGHRALEEDAEQEPILEFECLVCGYSANGVRIDCDECGSKETLIGEPWQNCSSCGSGFHDTDVKNLLGPQVFSKDDLIDGAGEATCGECESSLSVVPINDNFWFCTNCFTKFESTEIGACEWCNTYTTEKLENSYWHGCSQCEGQAGWTVND